MEYSKYNVDHTFLTIAASRQQLLYKILKHIEKKISYRKIKSINIESFIADCDLSNLLDNSIGDMVQQLRNKFKNDLDKNALIKTKVTTVRKMVPWFNESLRDNKRIV